MKTLGILTNGGDTCALNASIKSIRDSAYQAGYKKIYGIHRGYQGLLDGWIEDITRKEIDPRIGGSCLGSLRISPTRKVQHNPPDDSYEIDEDLCKKMVKCLAEYRIDVLVVIGGDGTLQATKMFQKWANSQQQELYRFNIIGFLKTIDNDIYTSTAFQGLDVSLCPGFPSAVKKIVSCTEDLRVTARTAERAIAIETMGRDAGWLAASATFGGAEIMLVPEHIDLSQLWERKGDNCGSNGLSPQECVERVFNALADEIVHFYTKNRNVLIVVAEGFQIPKDSPLFSDMPALGEFAKILKGLYGERKQVGATELVTLLAAPVLDYYFACLAVIHKPCWQGRIAAILSEPASGAVQEASREEILRKLIDDAMSGGETASARARYEEKVQDVASHPLKNWKVADKLLAALQSSASDCVCRVPPLMAPFNFEIRPHRTDYVPRSGAPSPYDYKLATVLGKQVGQMLLVKDFGSVPVLKEAVPYEKLGLDVVKTVSIDLIGTQNFEKRYYFDEDHHLQVSGGITNFFRTITSGPEDLEKAISETQ